MKLYSTIFLLFFASFSSSVFAKTNCNEAIKDTKADYSIVRHVAATKENYNFYNRSQDQKVAQRSLINTIVVSKNIKNYHRGSESQLLAKISPQPTMTKSHSFVSFFKNIFGV